MKKFTKDGRKILETLHYIDVNYACFGIISKNSKVINAAPIAKWSIGKDIEKVLEYYMYEKRAKIINIVIK